MYPSGSSRRRRGNPSTGGDNNSEVASSFAAFLDAWLVRQEHYLDELQSATESRHSQEAYLEDLVDRVLSHYQQYSDEKLRVAQHDASLLFSSPWLTCLERSSLWAAGFKPGLAIKLAVGSLGGELTGDQARRMEELRVRTRVKEKELDDEAAQLQESMACPVLGAVRRCSRMPRDGLAGEASEALGALRARMEAAVANADSLRMRTALGAMEILSPGQRVKLLTAAIELQLKIRSLGFAEGCREEMEMMIFSTPAKESKWMHFAAAE